MPAKCFIASHLWCMGEMEKYVGRHDWLLLQQDLDLVNPQLVQFFQWNNTVFLQVLLTSEINFPVNAIILDKRTFFVDPE